MSERTELLPGSFCWPELASPDPSKAKAFFGGLFGWSGVEVPSSDGTYTLLQLRGKDVGGLRRLSDQEQTDGIPPHFMSYISTASADASAAKAKQLGGKLLMEPFDVPEVGRMAVVMDPGGAVFALWEAKGHIGARLVGEESTLCWTELATKDLDGSKAFYGGLFGWTWKASESSPAEYVEIHRGGQAIGGVLPMKGEEWTGVPPHWQPYFFVADCQAAVSKTGQLGGSIVVPATEIPHVGTFAVLKDDQGAHFSVIAMPPPPPA